MLQLKVFISSTMKEKIVRISAKGYLFIVVSVTGMREIQICLTEFVWVNLKSALLNLQPQGIIQNMISW